MIEVSHLQKRYGATNVLDGLSLEIPSGSVFGLLGPNGAGKTTAFKCMLGLVRATSGRVLYDGAALSPATFERLAYVPERSVLYEWMTVAEHVEMNRRAFTAFDPARAGKLLTLFSIDPRKRARVLSKGMRTATMVALAFARHAQTLVLDEPTSGLDPVNQRHVLSLIIEEAARGTAVLFSSHQIGQVERAADRIAILDCGKLVLEGIVDDLKSERKVVEGVLPDADTPVDGLANDPRVLRLDRTGRVLRVLVSHDADGVGALLASAGASGVRAVDLGLEDIFLYAVSPENARADVVPTENAHDVR